MTFIAAKCPNCGGEIQLDDERKNGFCLYCGSSIDVKQTINEQSHNVTGSEEDINNWKSAFETYFSAFDFEKAEKIADKILQASPTNQDSMDIYNRIKAIRKFDISPQGCLSASREGQYSNERIVVIPTGVTRIGANAFLGCRDLIEVRIPDSVTSIEKAAFKGCCNLKEINIPENITYIGDAAFDYCISLETVIIPSAVKTIEMHLFRGCKELKNVSLPDGLSIIGLAAFQDCSNLIEVHIPDSVTHIEGGAFSKCSKLAKICIPPKCSIIESGTYSQCCSLLEVDIPEGVVSIKQSAFSSCSELKCVKIADSVKIIEQCAFHNCQKLMKICISERSIKLYASEFIAFDNTLGIDMPDSDDLNGIKGLVLNQLSGFQAQIVILGNDSESSKGMLLYKGVIKSKRDDLLRVQKALSLESSNLGLFKGKRKAEIEELLSRNRALINKCDKLLNNDRT